MNYLIQMNAILNFYNYSQHIEFHKFEIIGRV